MLKRGQLSLFLILGLVIIILTVLALSLNKFFIKRFKRAY